MFEKGDSSNRQKMNCCSSQQILGKGLSWFLSQVQEGALFHRFHSKTNRKSIGSSKNDTTDLQNSLPFERSAWFYVTITVNLEHFQFFNFETDFLKNKNFFQKTGSPFFS